MNKSFDEKNATKSYFKKYINYAGEIYNFTDKTKYKLEEVLNTNPFELYEKAKCYINLADTKLLELIIDRSVLSKELKTIISILQTETSEQEILSFLKENYGINTNKIVVEPLIGLNKKDKINEEIAEEFLFKYFNKFLIEKIKDSINELIIEALIASKNFLNAFQYYDETEVSPIKASVIRGSILKISEQKIKQRLFSHFFVGSIPKSNSIDLIYLIMNYEELYKEILKLKNEENLEESSLAYNLLNEYDSEIVKYNEPYMTTTAILYNIYLIAEDDNKITNYVKTLNVEKDIDGGSKHIETFYRFICEKKEDPALMKVVEILQYINNNPDEVQQIIKEIQS